MSKLDSDRQNLEGDRQSFVPCVHGNPQIKALNRELAGYLARLKAARHWFTPHTAFDERRVDAAKGFNRTLGKALIECPDQAGALKVCSEHFGVPDHLKPRYVSVSGWSKVRVPGVLTFPLPNHTPGSRGTIFYADWSGKNGKGVNIDFKLESSDGYPFQLSVNDLQSVEFVPINGATLSRIPSMHGETSFRKHEGITPLLWYLVSTGFSSLSDCFVSELSLDRAICAASRDKDVSWTWQAPHHIDGGKRLMVVPDAEVLLQAGHDGLNLGLGSEPFGQDYFLLYRDFLKRMALREGSSSQEFDEDFHAILCRGQRFVEAARGNLDPLLEKSKIWAEFSRRYPWTVVAEGAPAIIRHIHENGGKAFLERKSVRDL